MANKKLIGPEENPLQLDIRRFAHHVNNVGAQKAFLDFVYGAFLVADEIFKNGYNGKSYPKPPTRKGK